MVMVTSVTMWMTMLTAQAGASWTTNCNRKAAAPAPVCSPPHIGAAAGTGFVVSMWMTIGPTSARL